MSALSNYLEDALLNHVLGATTYTKPTALYVALYTTDPTDANTGTQVTGGGYTRIVSTFGVSSGGSISNNVDILFPVATASWGTVTHVGVFDASTGGNLLFHGVLTVSKVIGINDQFKIPSGSLTIALN